MAELNHCANVDIYFSKRKIRERHPALYQFSWRIITAGMGIMTP
jgi:hypothetical protein